MPPRTRPPAITVSRAAAGSSVVRIPHARNGGDARLRIPGLITLRTGGARLGGSRAPTRRLDCRPVQVVVAGQGLHGRRAGVDGCLNGRMTTAQEQPRVVSASRQIAAEPERIFELIADPAQQPRWDGNDNLATAPDGQRVRRSGDVFAMTLKRGSIRENHVVEFAEGRLIAWMPAEVGKRPPGHLWRWELEPLGAAHTRVTHTYDWTQL